MPAGWTQVPDPNVPDAFAVIADRVGGTSVYTSNAQLVVYKLVGDFDPRRPSRTVSSTASDCSAWQTTDASLADFGGFPSAVIEGTYRENDMTLNTSRRHVIATSGPDKYLVSLSVTTAASQAVATRPPPTRSSTASGSPRRGGRSGARCGTHRAAPRPAQPRRWLPPRPSTPRRTAPLAPSGHGTDCPQAPARRPSGTPGIPGSRRNPGPPGVHAAALAP